MAAFLCFMAVRLMAMHRILRDDGSIDLHCDPTAPCERDRAGEKLFVDDAGHTAPIADRESAARREAQVFVAGLGASSYIPAHAAASRRGPRVRGPGQSALGGEPGASLRTRPQPHRRRACRDGLSVPSLRTPRLLHDLAIARGDGRYTMLLAAFAKTDLLVLDDFGLAQLNSSKTAPPLAPPSSPASSPWLNGMNCSPTPSSTASSTTPSSSNSTEAPCENTTPY